MPKRSVPEGLARLAGRHNLDSSQLEVLSALAHHLAVDEHAPTAIRDPLEVLDAHLADSLSALEIDAVSRAQAIADIGAGAGMPGLALAAALPHSRVRLIESQGRKCDYMAELIAALALPNADPVCARVEEWAGGRESHDLVVARAVGAQPLVLEYAAPLLSVGGTIVDWRGRRGGADEAAALRAAAELGLERSEIRKVVPFEGARDRHLHVFIKCGPTPARFPRRVGVARKRPLGAPRAPDSR